MNPELRAKIEQEIEGLKAREKQAFASMWELIGQREALEGILKLAEELGAAQAAPKEGGDANDNLHRPERATAQLAEGKEDGKEKAQAEIERGCIA